MRIMIWNSILRLSLAYIVGGGMLVFLAAPQIFQLAPTRTNAGEIAGAIVNQHALISLILTIAALAAAFIIQRRGGMSGVIAWLPVILLSVAIVVQVVAFGFIRPILDDLIVQIGNFDTTPKDDPVRQRFGMFHGVSSLCALVTVLVGIGTVVADNRCPHGNPQG